MTSTSFNVGLGEGVRNSSKVLKPPGGGSSDIFGVAGGEAQQSPRKVKQYMASNISLTDGAAPMASGPGSTSSAASTASSVETPSPGSPTGSPTRNGTAQTEAQAEQVVEAGQAVAAAGKAPDGEPRGRQFQMESHFSLGYDKATTGPALDREARPGAPAAQEGNPVTGEGYKSAQGATPIRNRVPPGGYSSGLW